MKNICRSVDDQIPDCNSGNSILSAISFNLLSVSMTSELIQVKPTITSHQHRYPNKSIRRLFCISLYNMKPCLSNRCSTDCRKQGNRVGDSSFEFLSLESSIEDSSNNYPIGKYKYRRKSEKENDCFSVYHGNSIEDRR
jgi:hypothetical protein